MTITKQPHIPTSIAQRPISMVSALPSPQGRHLPKPVSNIKSNIILPSNLHPGQKNLNVDRVATMSLPEIPTSKPTNSNNNSVCCF